ncbi:MAG: hypothetical protein WD490_08860 [Opitutales bacterium]
MNHLSNHILQANFSPHSTKKGSALLLTLLVVSLLLVIVLAFTVYVRMELRSIAEHQNRSIARQNALLGLNLAVADLQRHLGPDRRSSATAALVDAAAEDRNAHWVGAWNTEGGFRNWLISGNEQAASPAQPDQDVGTGVPFLPGAAVAVDASSRSGYTIQSMLGPMPAIRLVGENTVGARPEDFVFAPLREITANTQPVGRYAWWVGDEGVKANIASPPLPLPPSGGGAARVADRLTFLNRFPNRGVPALGGGWRGWISDGADAVPDFETHQEKMVDRGHIPFLGAPSPAAARASFDDLTLSSAGVLSDSKNGGLRKDFSIAFEIPEASFENSEFTRVLKAGEDPHAYATDHDGSERKVRSGHILKDRFTKTVVNHHDPDWTGLTGYTAPSNANGWVYRGPTFDLLRDHYQLYRRVSQPFSDNAAVNAQVHLPNRSSFDWVPSPLRYAAFGDYHGQVRDYPNPDPYISSSGGNFEIQDAYYSNKYIRIRPLTTQLLPELIRYSYTFSLQSFLDTVDHDNDPLTPAEQAWRLRLIVNPFFVLHNPYNVKLVSRPLLYITTRSELHFIVTVPTQAGVPSSYNTGWLNMRKLIDAAGFRAKDWNETEQLRFILSEDGSPSGELRLAPGEVKLYTIKGTSPLALEDIYTSANENNRYFLCQAGIGDFFASGISMTVYRVPGFHVDNAIKLFTIPANAEFSVRINHNGEGTNANAEKPPLVWMAPEYHHVLSKLLPAGVTSPISRTAHHSWDQIRQVDFFPYDGWWTGPINSVPATRLRPPELAADPDGPKRYIGKMDMYMKPIWDGANRDNNFSLSTHNPRAMVQSIPVSGAQGPASTRGPVHWTGSIEAFDIGSANTPGFEERFWGSETALPDGSRSVTLFEVPRTPLTSITGLRHANLGHLPTSPAYALGNSMASPYVPSDQTWWRSYHTPTWDPVNERYWHLDDSHLLNEALLDSYFFSSVNPGLNGTGTAWNNPLPGPSVTLSSDPTDAALLQDRIDAWRESGDPLLYPHYRFVLPSGRSMADAEADLNLDRYNAPQTKLDQASDLRPHNTIAAYLLHQGAFNVNSTSVAAWRVMLSGLRDASVDAYTFSNNLSENDTPGETPFTRALPAGADGWTGSNDQLWNGFRSLSDTQIGNLATEIVAELKNRARNRTGSPRPFTTLAEFANRRPGPAPNPFSLKGLLQAALDRTLNANPSQLSNTVHAADTNYRTNKMTERERVTVPYANPAALANPTITGAPQWITQADLLERIGAQLSARSDTFTVRAYGERIGPGGGTPAARAWLEATVQRETAFIDPDNHPALPLDADGVSDVSRNFGRRFNILSIRWLSPDEI